MSVGQATNNVSCTVPDGPPAWEGPPSLRIHTACLIDFVRDTARIPVIETGAGVVNTYFDKDGDLEMGKAIINNAKTRRVSVCNALDCLLVHQDILFIDLYPAGTYALYGFYGDLGCRGTRDIVENLKIRMQKTSKTALRVGVTLLEN